MSAKRNIADEILEGLGNATAYAAASAGTGGPRSSRCRRRSTSRRSGRGSASRRWNSRTVTGSPCPPCRSGRNADTGLIERPGSCSRRSGTIRTLSTGR